MKYGCNNTIAISEIFFWIVDCLLTGDRIPCLIYFQSLERQIIREDSFDDLKKKQTIETSYHFDIECRKNDFYISWALH